MTVLIVMVASLAFSAFWQIKMIREINSADRAEGKRYLTATLLLLFGGIFYFYRRHSRAVPNGVETRIVFFCF
jgi:hypothetical protein